MHDRVNEILSFWFGANDNERTGTTDRSAFWFASDAGVDTTIATRFAHDVSQATSGEYQHWENDAQGRLALIILLDQFPRNLYRGQAAAFQTDPLALRICECGIEQGHDVELDFFQRAFFHMPMQHAENLDVQARGVKIYLRLLEQSDESLKKRAQGFYNFAVQHYDIIKRFNRFPHRNACLGRHNTVEEEQYLAAGGSRFGQ